MKSKVILILPIVVISLRLFLTLLPSFQIDMNSWQAWTARLVEVGPNHFYTPGYFADYFPGYLYILWVLGLIFKIFSISIFSNEFAITLKLITNVFDIGSAFLIYRIVLKYKSSWAKTAGLLYLANPALIFNSSVWGQVDGILTFFLVLSVYTIVELRKLTLWCITTAIAILVKPQALALLPLMFVYILRNFAFKKTVLATIAIPILLITLSLPFFPQDPILGLFKLLKSTAEGYKYTSLYAFNFWSIVGWWKPDTDLWFFTTYQIWGVFLYLITTFTLILSLMQKKIINNAYAYMLIALSVMIFFLFPTRVHERYLFPFFSFFLIFVMIRYSLLNFIIYTILSVIHFANLLYVYYFYNYVYNNAAISKPIIYTLYGFIDGNYKKFAFLTLIAFFILIIYYFHEKDTT